MCTRSRESDFHTTYNQNTESTIDLMRCRTTTETRTDLPTKLVELNLLVSGYSYSFLELDILFRIFILRFIFYFYFFLGNKESMVLWYIRAAQP